MLDRMVPPHAATPLPGRGHFVTWEEQGEVGGRGRRRRVIAPGPVGVARKRSQAFRVREAHGYDAGKKVNGRKRHVVVDTLGLIISVVVHAANVQDRDGAKLVMAKLPGWYPRLKLIWADGGYAGQLVEWAATFGGWVLEIVKRTDDVRGFKVLPHRWVVERALSEVEGSAGSARTGGTARTTST